MQAINYYNNNWNNVKFTLPTLSNEQSSEWNNKMDVNVYYDLTEFELGWVNEFKKQLSVSGKKDGEIINIARNIFASAGKKCPPCPNMYIEILILMKQYISPSMMKYRQLDTFLKEYPCFVGIHQDEQCKLMMNANWMVILFNLVSSRKHKGLTMAVVPKVVEGRHVTYITGSGQTKSTSNRVHIYQHEGNITPVKRPTVRPRRELYRLRLEAAAMSGEKRERELVVEKDSFECNSKKKFRDDSHADRVDAVDSIIEMIALLRENSGNVNICNSDGCDAPTHTRQSTLTLWGISSTTGAYSVEPDLFDIN